MNGSFVQDDIVGSANQDKDLTYMGLNHLKIGVDVCDVDHELTGEISSNSSNESDSTDEFERYLIQCSPSQVMARTKQTKNKTDSKGHLLSPGGQQIAIKDLRRSLRKGGHNANRSGFTSEGEGETRGDSSHSSRSGRENPGQKKRIPLAAK